MVRSPEGTKHAPMPSTPHHDEGKTRRSLANADLPRRVRTTLDTALALVSVELDPHLGMLLDEFEQQLYLLAERARHPGSASAYMQALRAFRAGRPDFVPQFMLELESGLAALRSAPATTASQHTGSLPGPDHVLSLVDDSLLDEDTMLREIASRQEGRASLAIHLLGQRFGVLAGTPALDAERLPLGPQGVCRALRNACHALQMEAESRELMYRLFDRMVMAHYAPVLEKLDATLDQAGILKGLTHVPVRVRPAPLRESRPAQEDPRSGARPVQAGKPPAGRAGTHAGAALP